MASRIVGKNARLYLDEFQAFLRLFEMEESFEVATEESTVYGDNFKTFEPIDANGSFSLTGRMDDAGLATEQDDTISLDKAVFDNLFIDPIVLTMLIEGLTPVAGRKCHYAKLLHGSMALQLPRGGLGSLRLSGNSKERISDGFMLALADVSLTAATDLFLPIGGVDVGAGFTKGIHAVCHIWKRTGAGTLTAAVQGAPQTVGAGTIATTGTTVNGTGTAFNTFFAVGDIITLTSGTESGEARRIASITSDILLTIDNAFSADQGAGTSYARRRFTDRLLFPTTTTVGAGIKEQAETTATEVWQRVRLKSTVTEVVSILVASRRYT